MADAAVMKMNNSFELNESQKLIMKCIEQSELAEQKMQMVFIRPRRMSKEFLQQLYNQLNDLKQLKVGPQE